MSMWRVKVEDFDIIILIVILFVNFWVDDLFLKVVNLFYVIVFGILLLEKVM